jgi:hypothetical protein
LEFPLGSLSISLPSRRTASIAALVPYINNSIFSDTHAALG